MPNFQPGGQHALAVAGGAAGFISGADQAKLDGLTPAVLETFAVSSTTASLGLAKTYACTDTTLDRTLTISTADITAVREFVVKDQSGTLVANGTTITIATEGSETIDGAASVAIIADFGVVRLYSDGTNLFSW